MDNLGPWKKDFTSISIREILNISKRDIWNIKPGRYNVLMDDGVVLRSSARRIIIDRHLMDIYLKYPNVPITHNCSCSYVVGSGVFNGNTHIRTLNNIFISLCDALGIKRYNEKIPLLKDVERVKADIYNDIILNISEYVTTIDATDFVSIFKIPEVKEILDDVDNHPDSIDKAHKRMIEWITTTKVKHPLVLPNKAGSVRTSQFNQCMGPRGFITDLDRTVFGHAIKTGFIRGMRTYHDIAIEARTPAKALNASEQSIRTAEYISRRLRLLGMVVGSPVHHDCGSTDLRKLVVTDRYLPNLAGKWYRTDKDPELRKMVGDETHLIGEYIYYRHVKGCKYIHRKNICTKCLGDLANNYREDTNLGAETHLEFGSNQSQRTLSFKHETKSVSGGSIVLDELASHYFDPANDNMLVLNSKLKYNNLSIVIPKRGMDKLADVLTISEVDIPMSNVGELSEVGIISDDRKVRDVVKISNEDRKANITIELLTYMRDNDGIYSLDNSGNYCVSLAKWNKKEPMFHIPLKEVDVLAFLKKIVPLVEGTGRKKYTYDEHLNILTDTLLSKLDMNFTLIEIMSYIISSYNPEAGNYRLSRNSPDPQISSRNDLFIYRSRGQLLPFGDQLRLLLTKPHENYSNMYGEGHPLDMQFMPQEYLEAKYKREGRKLV